MIIKLIMISKVKLMGGKSILTIITKNLISHTHSNIHKKKKTNLSFHISDNCSAHLTYTPILLITDFLHECKIFFFLFFFFLIMISPVEEEKNDGAEMDPEMKVKKMATYWIIIIITVTFQHEGLPHGKRINGGCPCLYKKKRWGTIALMTVIIIFLLGWY